MFFSARVMHSDDSRLTAAGRLKALLTLEHPAEQAGDLLVLVGLEEELDKRWTCHLVVQ